MKLFQHTAHLLLVTAFVALPLVGFAADVKVGGNPALMEPAKSVYDHYLMIQTELTKDSVKGLDEHANAIAKAITGDDMKMFAPEVAKQAETLAKTKDLKAAREAFKPLSVSLIKYLADKKVGKGIYHEAYCPMANASWLQTSSTIANPYYGKAMLTCGTLKN